MSVVSIDNAAASGDTVLLGGQAGQRYRIHSYVFETGGTTNITIKSGTTALTGAMPNDVNTGISSPWSPGGVLMCNVGDDLIINSSAAVQVSGHVDYSVVGGPGGGAIGLLRLDFSLAKNRGYLAALLP